jgi:UrcA family protein
VKGFLISLVAASALAGPAAHARDWDEGEARSIRVDASALDLSTPAGIDVLEGRIHRAVNRICGSDRDCQDEAWASTEDQVAWAIGRDEWLRRMAEERIAQLDACRYGCAPVAPAYYPAPPPPAPLCPPGGVAVTIVYASPATIPYPSSGWR